LGTLLNLAQVHLFSVATSLSGIEETELKPFLTIFGTGMRASHFSAITFERPVLLRRATDDLASRNVRLGIRRNKRIS
jgi:hypothetical protein